MLANGADPDERAAYRILHDAVLEPARAISTKTPATNRAKSSRGWQHAADQRSFDVISGEIVDGRQLLDSAAIQKSALRNAVLTAGMALTIDVLVHHKTPEIARSPG